jgi:hypothetical protein
LGVSDAQYMLALFKDLVQVLIAICPQAIHCEQEASSGRQVRIGFQEIISLTIFQWHVSFLRLARSMHFFASG